MPTYDYRCGKCGHELAVFQSIKDNPLVQCPKCRRKSLTRLIGSGSGIIFKGSGFYETDYKRSRTPEKREKADKPAKTEKKTDGGKKGPDPA
jgi:putative FmdB family regulatory protein